MALFRKNPVVVEARLFDGSKESSNEILAWIGLNGGVASRTLVKGSWNDTNPDLALNIKTLEGEMRADAGDWVIQEPNPTDDRRFYPCKPDIFEATYEPVSHFQPGTES